MCDGIGGAAGRAAGEALEGEGAECVLIGSGEAFAAELFLGCDPGGTGSGHGGGARDAPHDGPREAEVGEPDPAVAVEEDVGGLHGAVDDPVAVEVVEGASDLREEPARGAELHGAVLGESGGERGGGAVLGGEPEEAVGATVANDVRDVGMIEPRERVHGGAERLLGGRLGGASEKDLEHEGAPGAALDDALNGGAIALSDGLLELELMFELPARELDDGVDGFDGHRGGRCEAAQVALAGDGRDLGRGAAGAGHAGGGVVRGAQGKIRGPGQETGVRGEGLYTGRGVWVVRRGEGAVSTARARVVSSSADGSTTDCVALSSPVAAYVRV